MGDDMSAYRDVFLSESAEYVQSITDGLLALESNPIDLEPVEIVFRGAHSLKGMAAAMGYARTQELTHKMESLMATVRSRAQVADSTLIDLMLQATDRVRELIEDESTDQATITADDIIARLVERTASVDAGAAPESHQVASVAVAAPGEGSVHRVTVTLEAGCVLKGVRAYMVIKRLGHLGTVTGTDPSAREIEDEQFDRSFQVVLQTKATPETLRDAVMAVTEVEEASVEPVAPEPAPVAAPGAAGGTPASRPAMPKISETQTVRISIGHLDTMVNLVGELVIIRSRLEDLAARSGDGDLSESLGVLKRVSTELQQEVMQTRMVPVSNIFNRFPRMVRDLARDLGKDVALEMEGLDIELDRTVLDEIGDPIVHLLRNAIDHGVESPEERVAASKPARGTVRLVAERVRDQVLISVEDDGRGMDVDRIWNKAVERGLVDRASRDSYTDNDILMFVCIPAFTTVDHATRVSGRGVGMDVVKGKIEYLGGSVMLSSTPGMGMRISLQLPLTLAIIQALLVRSGTRVYALPLSAVDEVLSPDEVTFRTVDGAPVVALRDGSVVGLSDLDELHGRMPPEGSGPEHKHLILVRSGQSLRALSVPALLGRREVVIKPLSPLFRGLRGFGGATVLGDGRIALILDPRTLFTREV
ncbi:MAG: chemotaxis protein CheA [Coriobacteriia bacterium]|nr:chemotaxis protein CheA [Coriobacteriia bacterium]MBN2840789.1 chemotaxis protein CheA [Coriobacteriia bacterium]